MNVREHSWIKRFPGWANATKVHCNQIEMTGCRNNAAGVLRMITRVVLQKQRIVVNQGHELRSRADDWPKLHLGLTKTRLQFCRRLKQAYLHPL